MVNLKSKIYVAGHNGLVGSAIVRQLKKKGYKKIITANRSTLDLANQTKVFKFLKRKRPQFIFIAAAKMDDLKQLGVRLSVPARYPPISGPIAKPRLYAELYLPTYLVLSFGFVISDTSAEPTEILHEKSPAINLDRNNKGSVLAKAIIK